MSKRQETTPAEIETLKPEEVLVFSSNYQGRHNKGLALNAWTLFGARWGQAMGPMGQCYAIATKNRMMAPVCLEMVIFQIVRFRKFAEQHTDKRFLVTPIGCDNAGFTPNEIAPYFLNCGGNVVLPEMFLTRFKR